MIRPAELRDYPALLEIYARARRYMAETGNPNQWGSVTPPPEVVRADIEKGQSYVLEEDGEIAAVFVLQAGEEPNYARIEDGAWQSTRPYHTIHRIAASGSRSGVFSECIAWCYDRVGSLRIDTHADNKIMQHLILKNGFTRSGIIHIANGTPRIAYERP